MDTRPKRISVINMGESILPVFLKKRDVSEVESEGNAVRGLEICLAAERSAGKETIDAAQDVEGLWRIHPLNKVARNNLLIKGIVIRDTLFQISDTNPYLLRGGTGMVKPATRLSILNVPMSVANSEIEHALAKIGVEFRSGITMDCYRNADKKLTRFKTGTRFLFITVPSSPLEKQISVAGFKATLYHKEQKMQKRAVKCSKCLSDFHHVSVCTNDWVCLVCKTPGHKRGDPACPGKQQQHEKEHTTQVNEGEEEEGSERGEGEERDEIEDESGDTGHYTAADDEEGRHVQGAPSEGGGDSEERATSSSINAEGSADQPQRGQDTCTPAGKGTKDKSTQPRGRPPVKPTKQGTLDHFRPRSDSRKRANPFAEKNTVENAEKNIRLEQKTSESEKNEQTNHTNDGEEEHDKDT